MKKLLLLLIIAFSLGAFNVALAQDQAPEQTAEINFFFSPTCPHCIKESKFLDELEQRQPQVIINRFPVTEKENIELLKEFYQEYNVPESEQGMVPATFTRDNYFIGYDNAIREEIEACVEHCLNQGPAPQKTKGEINLPIIGKINITKFSPLALAIVLGGLDGFNACAMMALIFLLTILIASGIRERVILIGGVFIFVSGIVYFLFISAWLNLFLVLEQIKFITYLVSITIIIFSLTLLKDYFYGVVCKLCRIPTKQDTAFVKVERKLFKKMTHILTSRLSLPLMLLGVAFVAAGINMVELVCSFGFPLAFTKMLSSLNLSTASYYFYLFVYILFYMLDDFIVFLLAVFTLRTIKTPEKYLKPIKLISGLVLLLLGLIMLLRPELLSFAS